MNEDRYASRIRQALNHGLKDISPAASRRLEAARHLALSKQKQLAPELALATTGLSGGSSQHTGSPFGWAYGRQILAIAALLIGMWLSFYWHSVEYVSELEAIDSALLSDDLPPEAFLDNDIFEWLKSDDSSPD
jgi:hypothetical protein